jgi:hypothetical protein
MAELEKALSNIDEAAGVLFHASPAVRSVGVGRVQGEFGYIAVRNRSVLTPFAGGGAKLPDAIEGVPVMFVDSARDPESLVRVPHSGAGSPSTSSLMPEQQQHRPLVCGLEIQNFDQDRRSGDLANGLMSVGTLGCFVKLAGGEIAMLSNNHVVAGVNSGVCGSDPVSQPGVGAIAAKDRAGELTNFIPLQTSPPGIIPPMSGVNWNEVDAGVATLLASVHYLQAYLPARTPNAPNSFAAALIGDKVHKVGRTTGLTYGEVTQIAVQVSVNYTLGICWFRDCIVVETLDGTTFSNHGDSGSAIVRDDGAVLGLLFAGNAAQTYACDIDHVFAQLNCKLA